MRRRAYAPTDNVAELTATGNRRDAPVTEPDRGQRRCPPEDCDGPWGFAELIEAIKGPKHERHDEHLMLVLCGVLYEGTKRLIFT